MRSDLEKVKHQYLQTFFNQLADWYQKIDPSFLKKMEVLLISQIEKQKNSSFNKVDLQERELHLNRNFREQIPSRNFDKFLQNVRSHLQHQIIHNWSFYFFTSLDDFIGVDEKKGLPIAAENKELSSLCESVKMHWELYLIDPHNSFYKFLEKITGLSLQQ